jgi:hypothetical protein
MNAPNLLTKLRGAGLQVAANGDALIIRPRDLLTDELRAEIRAHKRGLLAELPRYRWRIIDPVAGDKEVCCLPEMTEAEMRRCYPSARLFALPDAVADCRAVAGA